MILIRSVQFQMDLFGPFIIYYGKFYRKDHQYPLLSNTTWAHALLACGIDDSSNTCDIKIIKFTITEQK